MHTCQVGGPHVTFMIQNHDQNASILKILQERCEASDHRLDVIYGSMQS